MNYSLILNEEETEAFLKWLGEPPTDKQKEIWKLLEEIERLKK